MPPKARNYVCCIFDDNAYTADSSTILYKFVDALAGTTGAGALINEYFLARMGGALETIYFNELDFIFSKINFMARSPAESYTYNPLRDMLTADQWNEVRTKDAWYRSRIKDFFKATTLGGTPDGIRQCVEAAVAVDCDVYEVWRYCADEETEILTRSGYKHYTEVKEGEETLALNVDTGLAEWQPILAVNIFPVVDEPMLSIEMGGLHSSLTTMDHRWPVQRRQRKFGRRAYSEISIRRSHELTTEDRFIRAAAVTNLPEQPKYADSLVELIGWFVTEGHIHLRTDGVTSRKGVGDYTGLNICQSHKVNPTKVDRIRSALTKLFGPSVESFTNSGKWADRSPQWRETVAPSKPDLTLFRLSSTAGKVLTELAPKKVASLDFVYSLTESQLRLFLDSCLAGDGHVRTDGYRSIVQNSMERLVPMQVAATLLGIPTSFQAPTVQKQGKPTVVLSFCEKNRFVVPLGQGRKNASTKSYSGSVWCPTTANGTWFARRRGTTYFTGNTDNFGLLGDLGRSPHAARNEVVIRPHKDVISPSELRLLRDMLDKIVPVDTIVTVNASGLAVATPVPVQAAAADSSYFEVQRMVTATPVLATLPPPELLAIDLLPTEEWLFLALSDPQLAPYSAFNISAEFGYYYLVGGGRRSPIDSVSYGTLQPNGTVKAENNYSVFLTTQQYTPRQPYPLADSPDNYPGGKFGRFPTLPASLIASLPSGVFLALNPDGTPYRFAWTSQAEFVAAEIVRITALGGDADSGGFRLPIQASASSAKVFFPEYGISYFPPARESTVTTAPTSRRGSQSGSAPELRDPTNFVRT